jgi:hypothetical protein
MVLRFVVIALVVGLSPEAGAEETPSTMFGGQLVRPTTLAGTVAIELGGGGALYATERFYWGGGGGSVFQLGEPDADMEVELFHGELMVGYDLVQESVLVSVLGLGGVGMTKQHDGIFGVAEARLAVRKPLTGWFMIGGHIAYRRAFATDIDQLSNAELSGPVVGVELYFTK